ncbi:MAG TPA: hypothetical protein DCR35_06275 [Runella sp.]|nr:hypothetical protein [Runella sp.]HAO48922.1 hypothetical protein [Runella sp.]
MENRITINPEICHGKPTIRNSRLLVKTVLELLAGGMTYEELLADYPNLEVEDIHACLNFAAQIVNFRSVSVAA